MTQTHRTAMSPTEPREGRGRVTTTVNVPGQVGWNAKQDIDDSGCLHPHTIRALENIEKAVMSGGTRHDVLSLRIYIVGEWVHDAIVVRGSLRAFFYANRLPSSKWMGVSALISRDVLIEIEAAAEVD